MLPSSGIPFLRIRAWPPGTWRCARSVSAASTTERQILSHDGQPDPSEPGHRIIFRNCTIRRSVGGAFMGLRDEAVYACDYRNPQDPSTVKKFLDDPDHEKLRSEAYKVKLPLFKRG